jgi:signal transduction histidine kinase
VARIRTQLEVDRAHPDLADQRGTQESVLAEVVTLQRLVDDLLLLARGDAGAADPRRAGPIDLDDVVRRLAAERRLPGGPELDTRGVVPVQLWGDAAGLDRAVANLLDNAVRHARGRVSVTLESAAAAVVLTVSDDGPGIPEASREAVFERFVRLDAARSSHSGGAGLGLAIARDIAERHGGTLTVDAAGVAGARFVLVLRGDAESQPPGVRAASPG